MLRRGKREGRGERSIKSLVPYRLGHSGQLSASGGDQGQKGPSCSHWVWSIGRQAGPWVPRVVRMSVSAKKSPHQSHYLLQEGGPLPGPKTGLLSNTRKWIVWGDTCADKARDFIGKGTRVESSRVREPRRSRLAQIPQDPQPLSEYCEGQHYHVYY